jgi:hypothetical protein
MQTVILEVVVARQQRLAVSWNVTPILLRLEYQAERLFNKESDCEYIEEVPVGDRPCSARLVNSAGS